MKSKFNSRPQSEQQYDYGMRDSIAGLAVSMAAVCGVAPHQRSDSRAHAMPLSDLYMGMRASVDQPHGRFEAMLQASGGFARRLDLE